MRSEIVVVHSNEYGQKGFYLERHKEWASSEDYVIDPNFAHELLYHILPDEIGKVEQEIQALGVFLYLEEREATSNTGYTIISAFNDSDFPNLPECPKDYTGTARFIRFYDGVELFEDPENLESLVFSIQGDGDTTPEKAEVIMENHINIINWLCYGYENAENKYKYFRGAVVELSKAIGYFLIIWKQRNDLRDIEDGTRFLFEYDFGIQSMKLTKVED